MTRSRRARPRQFAREHGIPVRRHGIPVRIASAAAPGHHPRDLPEPLRRALTGRNAQQCLLRLLIIARHASIHKAAAALGLWPSILYTQIAHSNTAAADRSSSAAPAPADAGSHKGQHSGHPSEKKAAQNRHLQRFPANWVALGCRDRFAVVWRAAPSGEQVPAGHLGGAWCGESAGTTMIASPAALRRRERGI
jgi:hypothetical protein